jgi:FkbM family methyltransferase
MQRRFLSGIIRRTGPIGLLIGRIYGWPLPFGFRMRIDDPHEWIQKRLLEDAFEPGVSAVIKAVLQPGDIFFDAGANRGYYTLLALKCGASVTAFEPVPRLYQTLQTNLRMNGIDRQATLEPLALGEDTHTATIYVASRKDDGSHSLIAGVEASAVVQQEVQVTSLDQYLVEKRDVPSLIKIDVEGYEARVLDGAQMVLNTIQPPVLIFETADRLASALGESAASVLGRLYDCGYRIFAIHDDVTLTEVSPDNISGAIMDYVAVHPTSPKLEVLASLIR